MITEEQARAAWRECRRRFDAPAETPTDAAMISSAMATLDRRAGQTEQPDDGPITAELRSILQGLDELAELWGDEAKFRRMRDRLRAVVQRGEPSENPGQLPHISRGQMNNIGASR